MAEATRGASPAELRERVAAGGSGSASEPSRHGHAASVDDIVRGDLEIDSRSRSPGTPAVEEEASLHAHTHTASAHTSLSSSAFEFRFEHGRRYHSYRDGLYSLPNDARERERLEIEHQIWYIMLNGRLHLSPLTHNITDALDIGCGTGSWAIDFATTYPSARVTGTDLSPIQPTNAPSNVSFLVDDANSDWVFNRRFDFIHTRAVNFGIRDWSRFAAQGYEHLRPGGWLELQEPSGPFRCDDASAGPDSAAMRWSSQMQAGMAARGIDVQAPRRLAAVLQDQGFINVEEVRAKWAIGPWPKGRREKRIGELYQQVSWELVEAISLRFYTKELGWDVDDVRRMVAEVREDIRNPELHMYTSLYIYIAQKPDEEEDKTSPEDDEHTSGEATSDEE